MNRKIHILHVIKNLRPFGGTPVKLLYQVLNSSPQFKFTICCVVDEGELSQRFKDAGIEVIVLNRKKNYDLGQVRDIMGLIKKHDIDIVHTHFARSNTYGRIAALLSGKPSIVSEHGMVRNTILPIVLCDNLLNFGTSHLIANSKATLGVIQKKVFCHRSNMSVIYNGVLDQFKNYLSVPKETCKRDYGFRAEDFIVLNVGSQVFWRKHETFIDAAAKIRERIPNLKIVQIGDGPEHQKLVNAVKDYQLDDIFHFWGNTERDKIHAFIRAADIYVNAAILEGFGFATVEAMLCEVPVICARAGSLIELINHNEEGIFFEPEQSDELADSIYSLYQSQQTREKLGKAARRRALEKFSINRFVSEFEEKYQSMILHPVTR